MNFKFYRNGTGALHNYISTHIRHDLTFLARPGIGSRKFSDEGEEAALPLSWMRVTEYRFVALSSFDPCQYTCLP